MSRDEGFRVADLDTGVGDDPKVVALARRLRDPGQTAAHLGLYVALIAKSWGAGQRLTLADAAPAWWLDDVEPIRENLAAVGLLDADGRIPDHAWSSWYSPAAERLERTRERWRRGNARRHRDATARSQRGDIGDPDRTGPDRSEPTAPVLTGRSTPPPPPVEGPRMKGTNARAVGANPRALGTSSRQERDAEKRGGAVRLGEILAGVAAASAPDPDR